MSGIYIKGMGMPTGSHEIIIRIQSDGRVLDQYGHRFNLEPTAIPVPEHGALIDRDDFFATCPELVDGYKHITDDLVVIPADKEGERDERRNEPL